MFVKYKDLSLCLGWCVSIAVSISHMGLELIFKNKYLRFVSAGSNANTFLLFVNV